jgi:hypothetical protein
MCAATVGRAAAQLAAMLVAQLAASLVALLLALVHHMRCLVHLHVMTHVHNLVDKVPVQCSMLLFKLMVLCPEHRLLGT